MSARKFFPSVSSTIAHLRNKKGSRIGRDFKFTTHFCLQSTGRSLEWFTADSTRTSHRHAMCTSTCTPQHLDQQNAASIDYMEMPMPQLVPSMAHGVLRKWLVKEGDEIQVWSRYLLQGWCSNLMSRDFYATTLRPQVGDLVCECDVEGLIETDSELDRSTTMLIESHEPGFVNFVAVFVCVRRGAYIYSLTPFLCLTLSLCLLSLTYARACVCD